MLARLAVAVAHGEGLLFGDVAVQLVPAYVCDLFFAVDAVLRANFFAFRREGVLVADPRLRECFLETQPSSFD